jgi:hypothetical protein
MGMLPIHARRTYFLLFLIPLLIPAGTTAAAVPFVNEVVDAGPDVGEWASLAIDRNGNPHISYYDDGNGDLKYATRKNMVWIIDTVDSGEFAGQYTSIAVNTAGEPRISYILGITGGVRYIAKTAGVWGASEQVDGSSFHSFTSLALDSQDRPRISYYDVGNDDTHFAEKDGGAWSPVTVTTTGGGDNTLALDAEDNPYVLYYDTGDTDLLLRQRNSLSSWTGYAITSFLDDAGLWNDLALDSRGVPYMCFTSETFDDLNFATLDADENVVIESIDAGTGIAPAGHWNSIAVDQAGNPHVSYFGEDVLLYSRRIGSTWETQIVDFNNNVGSHTSIGLDAWGNPMIAYRENRTGMLKFSDAAIHLITPLGGETWPVGATRSIEWKGGGVVDVLLSVDGGQGYEVVATNQNSNQLVFQVPHTPSRFAKIRVLRADPFSISDSDSFFTIEADIVLLNLKASLGTDGRSGAVIGWSTDPGPSDLGGYRLDKAIGTGSWFELVSLTSETSHHDPTAAPGDRYRLFGVNGFGTERLLGEVSVAPAAALAAWPTPYRGGTMTISFATAGGVGGGPGKAAVTLFDGAGRMVRTLASGDFEAGFQIVTWDGHDHSGRRVSPGVYFVRSEILGQKEQLKIVVLD